MRVSALAQVTLLAGRRAGAQSSEWGRGGASDSLMIKSRSRSRKDSLHHAHTNTHATDGGCERSDKLSPLVSWRLNHPCERKREALINLVAKRNGVAKLSRVENSRVKEINAE